MVRLVELLREHRPVLSCRVQEEAGLLILVAYHRHGSSADFLLDTAEAYFREKDCGGFLFLCRMQASINAYDEYPHLNVLCNRLAGLLFRFRRERESEYRKGIPPMFGKADLQEVEKYLPHLRGCSFREEVALALPKVKNVEELARECAMSVNTLGRRFREELNTTPHRWLTEQRKAHVISLLADTVSEQLGVPVDYTVCVDLKGFTALVDAIGGIDFEVPINMNYDDPIQNLSIHFQKGMQHLNGADALRVVRFRHNNDGTGYGSEDLGRMSTQQNFLKAVAKKMFTAGNIATKIDDYARIFNQYVETDLTLGNLVWLGTEVLKMGVDKIDFSTLPNEWHSPYIYLDPTETLTVVNTYLNPYVEDRTAEDLNLPS